MYTAHVTQNIKTIKVLGRIKKKNIVLYLETNDLFDVTV